MKLLYNNKDIDLYNCKSFFSRFKGFMMEKNINRALLFDKCNSIHTLFDLGVFEYHGSGRVDRGSKD